MPICDGCGSSYDDKFRFCPYCGGANPKLGIIPAPISREICNLDKRKEIVDKDNAVEWWEAVCNNKVIDRTSEVKYRYDKKNYKIFRDVSNLMSLRPDIKDMKTFTQVVEIGEKQFRELISRLLANGWEIASSTEYGEVRVMQRVKM